jgi:hypothetical protein
MTETNAYGPNNTGIDYVSHPTSTGRVMPIMRIEIRDPIADTCRSVSVAKSGSTVRC